MNHRGTEPTEDRLRRLTRLLPSILGVLFLGVLCVCHGSVRQWVR